MSARPPIIPVSGTELERAAIAASHPELISAGEQVFTTDQRRLWLYTGSVWQLLSAPVHHGTVADDPAMLALATASARGVWPGDTCYRTDAQTEYRCASGSGATAVWVPTSVIGMTVVTPIDSDLATLTTGVGVTVTAVDSDLATLTLP